MYLMFLNPNSCRIHSADAVVRPSSVSYGGAKYGRGAQVCSARVSALVMSPSMSSSDRPASAIAFRHASLPKPPQLLSMVTPSQRRSIWDWPHPTMATLPWCSQTPIPSRFLIQLVSAISAPSCPLCCAPLLKAPRGLGHHPPLVDQLTGTRLLKDQLHGGSNGDLARRGTRQVGQEVDARVLVQGDHRKVDGLRRPESPDARVADHEVHVDVSLALHLFPLQMVARATLVAPLGGRIMQPLAGGAVLQDQAPRVTGVPEGLVQIVGNRGRSLQTWDR